LYAQDALVEYPFALPVPTRLDGREAIRRYFAAVARMPLELRARNITVHQTGDPEVIVAEWDYDGLVITTGRSFQEPPVGEGFGILRPRLRSAARPSRSHGLLGHDPHHEPTPHPPMKVQKLALR
jgi:SnoaL-like domain